MAIKTNRTTTVTLERLPSGGDYLEVGFTGTTDQSIVDITLVGCEVAKSTFTVGQLRDLIVTLKREGLDLSAYVDSK
jgi:hypothetical protein